MKKLVFLTCILTCPAQAFDISIDGCAWSFVDDGGERTSLLLALKPQPNIFEQLRNHVARSKSKVVAGDEQDHFEHDRWMELAAQSTDILLGHLDNLHKEGTLSQTKPALAELVRFYLAEADPQRRRETLMVELSRTRIVVGSRSLTFNNLWTEQAEKEWRSRPL